MAAVEVDDRAYRDGIPRALEEYRLISDALLEEVADKVVERAKALVPKRTGRLAESIRAEPLVRDARGASVTVVAGGPGIRETIFVEFGTSVMRAEPYMRPALAAAAGGLRSIGVAARLAYSDRARLFARRARARAKVRRAQNRRKNRLVLSLAEARATGRFISQRFRFRGGR